MSDQPRNAAIAPGDNENALENREWMDALSAVISAEGPQRAHAKRPVAQMIHDVRLSMHDADGIAHPMALEALQP